MVLDKFVRFISSVKLKDYVAKSGRAYVINLIDIGFNK